MFLNYSGTVEERLGALLLLMLHCEKPAAMANLFSKVRRRTFLKYWEWLMPFMQQSRAEERAAEALRQARRREEYDSF